MGITAKSMIDGVKRSKRHFKVHLRISYLREKKPLVPLRRVKLKFRPKLCDMMMMQKERANPASTRVSKRDATEDFDDEDYSDAGE